MDPARTSGLGPAMLEAVAWRRAGTPADADVWLLVLYHTASDPPKIALGERLKIFAKPVGVNKQR